MTTNTNAKAHGCDPVGFQKTNTNGTNSLTSEHDVQALSLTTTAKEPRVDSRLLAKHLGNNHKSVIALIDRYLEVFKSHGQLTFKKEVGVRDHGGGNAERYALLNEDQAYFLLSLSRNTERVVALKSKLIKSFGEYRRAADMRQQEYLPSYHELQNVIHLKAAESSNERMVHINVAKLVNKTVGIETGQRAEAPVPKQAMLIVAQSIAARAMQLGHDHRDGYRLAQRAMQALTACTKLGVVQ